MKVEILILNLLIHEDVKIYCAQHALYCIACRRRNTGYAAYGHPLCPTGK